MGENSDREQWAQVVDSPEHWASDHGTRDGVPFLAVPEAVELVAPVLDVDA